MFLFFTFLTLRVDTESGQQMGVAGFPSHGGGGVGAGGGGDRAPGCAAPAGETVQQQLQTLGALWVGLLSEQDRNPKVQLVSGLTGRRKKGSSGPPPRILGHALCEHSRSQKQSCSLETHRAPDRSHVCHHPDTTCHQERPKDTESTRHGAPGRSVRPGP